MQIEFSDLVGKTAILCAVDDHKFRLGNITFEAIEDESDGYRSILGQLKVVDNIRPLFREDVKIENSQDNDFDGFDIVGKYGVILSIGTNYTESYYPIFCFSYRPQRLSCNASIDNLLNTIDEFKIPQ